jgi:Flp pilus assembly protein TadD
MKVSNVPQALSVAVCLALAVAGCQTIQPRSITSDTKSSADLKSDERARNLYLSVIEQLIQQEKYHAALAHLDEFERMYKGSPVIHRLRGDAWLALGDLPNAKREYTGISKGALAGYGKHGLGRVEAAQGAWPRASQFFGEAVREQPTNIRFLNDFGGALLEIGELSQAEFQLRKALELSPADETVKSNLEILLSRSGNTVGAPAADTIRPNEGRVQE